MRGEGFGDGFVDEDAFGRHADLTAMEEGAEGAGLRRARKVGVFEDDGGSFAAKFHQDRFERFAALLGDDAAGGGAAGEVYLLDEGVRDDCRGDGSGVGGAVEDYVEAAGGEAGFMEDLPDDPEAARGELGAFEDTGVAGCEGVGDGADAEDEGGVPVRC